MGFLPHVLPPLNFFQFIAALEVGRVKVQEGIAQDRESIPPSEILADPERFEREQAADNMTSRMLGAIQVFQEDGDLALSCEFRRSYVLPLASKRCFKRYVRKTGGRREIAEPLLRAIAQMHLTTRMLEGRPAHRRRLKRALLREIRRQVANN
jgi:hypothetical protein